jgi:4-hydroxy-tetrahydrodipicolinate reductase
MVLMSKDAKILNIAILGTGRMGQEIMRAMAGNHELNLVGVWTRTRNPMLQKDMRLLAEQGNGKVTVSDDLTSVLSDADVAIDFSLPQATHRILDAVLTAAKPLVIGVSGLEVAAINEIEIVSRKIPILYDRNMSLGIAVLDRLLRQAARSLGADFEAEIHETHHKLKIDAPSGTALQLGASLAQARNQDFESIKRYEVSGLKRPLASGEIGFTVTRKGDIPGEHTIILYNESERLELKHVVSRRRVFADGALRAAHWLANQPAGLYMMRDLLFSANS